ncbi:urea ABC transporter permease subunit UrtB [Pseudomonas sp. GD03842]|uniref:urea ABC transporter permease subunit UrtB n=1 Tax=unclassified Pseudomonas TaxID=196821 RepID=UPI0015B0CA03|nr:MULTISPECIES: urea ABC transporter permease subunit UrtB [unclassified Pseudomonas]MDH0748697.1 urea ABC transporter permease subunit UrtB [Pseudomonas sp. GD03842]
MQWLSEFGAIAAMQGFNGLSVFCVLLLMALGLAIIFGQMGVINMAHGEFLTLGAYTTYMLSTLVQNHLPSMQPYYFFFAIALSFVVAGAIGWAVERVMISRLYHRPLDTLLATWGLSLVMQQAFRSIFGAREVSANPPEWLMGAVNLTDAIEIPKNGLFVMALTALLTGGIFLMLYRTRWGLQVRATVQNRVMSRAVGINTRQVDRMTFALGCGVAGVAGAAFTTIGSTGPTAGSLYIVDTFLTVVFGGAQSLLGTIASAFAIAQTQSVSEFFMSGSMAKVLTLSTVILILLMRPQGLFSSKVRK